MIKSFYILDSIFKFSDNCDVLGNDFIDLMNEACGIIMIIIPILLVILIILDMVKAISANDDKMVNEAKANAIKRVIIGVLIYFLPMVVNVILKAAGIATGTCGI